MAKQSASFKQHKLRQLFLRQQHLFFSMIFNTGNIIFDQSGKFDMVRKKEKLSSRHSPQLLSTDLGDGGVAMGDGMLGGDMQHAAVTFVRWSSYFWE